MQALNSPYMRDNISLRNRPSRFFNLIKSSDRLKLWQTVFMSREHDENPKFTFFWRQKIDLDQKAIKPDVQVYQRRITNI